ncbi:Asp23/Gls24 family envelope stress response protein [Rhodococcus hoagii]|nr:Asp23/Gls24 family envelope stress response protein [Prescottella equi]
MTTDPGSFSSSAGRAPVQFGSGPSSDLVSSQGRTIIADAVVAKIAGIATREIDGVYDVGGGTARVVGHCATVSRCARQPRPGRRRRGRREAAAIDIGIVAEYGVALHELAAGIRRNVIAAVENMTGSRSPR